tara:strand:- start:207 stop:419 length:213 start_codon:yes stop_codon:yes gene_type:complete
MDLVDRVEACIQIFGRSVYGETRIYVADETQANAIRKITTTKTLTTIQMRGLEELGFEFQEVIDPKSRIV